MVAASKRVFISSTFIDLPEHRQKVIETCNQLKLIPDGMEHWPASDATSLELCLGKVDKADLFVGVYAHRYGWVPPRQSKSITELEYDRAVERGIPRHLFVMGENHPVRAKDVETGPGAEALKAFKQRIGGERVWKTFDNADQLHAHVLHALMEVIGSGGDGSTDIRVDLTHLPAGAPHFLGRETELALLDTAWAEAGHAAIVEFIAPGGTGKTALLKRWLESMQHAGWRGARRVYGWSFYSQGTSDDKQASEDNFLATAVKWFGVRISEAASPWDKGRALAEAVVASRTLLLLDGVEPLQYPPGPLAGELRAPGLEALLTHLASAGQGGLCVLSSRVAVKNLDEWTHPGSSVRRQNLSNLAPADGARLLHAMGANRAGKAAIAADDGELQTASGEVQGHALTLALLGSYLALAYEGDIRRRDEVKFSEADAETSGGHAFKVIAAYETWFSRSGQEGARELATLRLLGFFDRPASADSLAALRAAPAIAGLTEALADLSPAQWRASLKRLQSVGLIHAGDADGSLDAHPLVREYLAEALKTRQPDAWREGHRRLYEQLKASAPHRPEGLAALQPLYQAVAHGCLAERWQEAREEVYRDRILRGTGHDGFYSTKKLGAHGNDLGAVACFFVEAWRQAAPALSEAARAWLLNQAATSLRALGRLDEALEPMRAGAQMRVTQEDWENAARSYGNLSELQLSLGRVAAALADAEQALAHAERSGDAFHRMSKRTTLADALHQRGARPEALARFVKAEAMQAEDQADYPLLYSLRGFQYCELLLAEAERAAWRGTGSAAGLTVACADVAQRGKKMFEWRVPGDSLLDIALDHLTLARCALYANLLHGQPPDITAQAETEHAVAGLRAAGAQEFIPRGLLTRALLRQRLGDLSAAHADLDEAERIAARGGMKLHLADIALHRARLFHDKEQLAKARALIEECGYGRRLPELEDAEAAAKLW